MSKIRFSLPFVLILLVLLQACGSSPSPVSTPTLQGTIDLKINSLSSFTDTYGTYHVVGEIINDGSGPASVVELSLEIRDQAGNSLLRDDLGDPVPAILVHPMLETLSPYQSSPFAYALDPAEGIPAEFSVEISGYQYGFSDRADLESQNVQIQDNGQGWYYLSGELVNKGDQWVSLNGLAGGVMDNGEQLLSADGTGIYVSALAPSGDASGRDRTPFLISLPNPGLAVGYWKLYWDADWMAEAPALNIGVSITNTYFDQFGAYHLVGWVSNSSDQSQSVLAVAGLYAEDGVVLDASIGQPVIQVDRGDSVPINMVGFPNVDYSQEQAQLVRTQKMEIDPLGTYPVSTTQLEFSPASESVMREGATWLVTGEFLNSSDQLLSGVTVVVTVLDPLGNLVAADFNYILATAAIAPGESNPYEVYLLMDPIVDRSEYITQTTIYGQVIP